MGFPFSQREATRTKLDSKSSKCWNGEKNEMSFSKTINGLPLLQRRRKISKD
jgi:hypothetical protein